MGKLRWYQDEAVDAGEAALAGEKTSTLLVLATGLGKTQVFAELARIRRGDVLVLAHREELVDQAVARISEHTGEYVEAEQADRRSRMSTRIVVGSVQTLTKKVRRERLGLDRFSLVIIDETHHYLARTYREVVESFSGKRVGFTATPDRSDKRGLAALFESVAYNMGILEGIEHGYLVPIIGEHVELGEVDLSGVERQQGDLVASQLDDVMVKAVEGIVKKTLDLHPEKRAIGFFPGLKSAEYATERINALEPGSTCFVSSKTDPVKRRELVLAFKAGEYKRLFNVGICTEGFDAPDVSLIIGARPTCSRSLFSQMVGRGTRVLPGVAGELVLREQHEERRHAVAASEKPACVLLDFVGNAGRHRLVGPEDILGERYSEEERKLSRRVAKERPGMDVLETLAEARERLAEAARRLQSRVSAKVTRFDPFEGMGGSEGERVAERDARFGAKPITSGQLQALMNLGMLRPDAEKLSQRQAKKMLEMLRERRKNKLSTYRQNQRLRQLGVPDLSNMTFEAASRIIGHRGQVEVDLKARRVRLLRGIG